MLAAFCTFVAVIILTASALAAGVVKSERLNLVLSGDYVNNSRGGKRQMFEKDDKRSGQLRGVLGTIQLTSLVDGSTTSLVLNSHTLALDESHTSGTPIFMALSTQPQVPYVLDRSVAAVTLLVEGPFMTPRCVTADADPAHTGGPLTVEPCFDFNGAKAHKTQVFQYEKVTGFLHVQWDHVKVSFVTLVPPVPKTKDDKDSSSADVTTANTATASRRIAIFDEEWVPSTTNRRTLTVMEN